MIKFIIPAVIVFLIILFWEKIESFFLKKFNIKINYIILGIILLVIFVIFSLLYFSNLKKNINQDNYVLSETEGVFTLKNKNTTIGFVRFNEKGEVEYIFVNPIFRKKGFAKKLLKLVKDKTGNKLTFQKPISPLGQKLIKTIEKWS